MASEFNRANGFTKVNEFTAKEKHWFEVLVARKGQFTFIKSYSADPRGNEEVAKAVKEAGGDLSKAKYFHTDFSDLD